MVSRPKSKGVREWKDLARTHKGRHRNKVNVFAQKLSQKRYALWQVGLKYLHIVRQHPHPLLQHTPLPSLPHEPLLRHGEMFSGKF